MALQWHRRKGLGGLYAPLADGGWYDIRLSLSGEDYILRREGENQQLIGRFRKQVEAKRAAEAHAE